MAAVASEMGGLGAVWSYSVSACGHLLLENESTHSRNVALLVGLFKVEETMNEQEIKSGSDPLIGLGHRSIPAQCEELVQSPVSSVLCHLGVHSIQM